MQLRSAQEFRHGTEVLCRFGGELGLSCSVDLSHYTLEEFLKPSLRVTAAY